MRVKDAIALARKEKGLTQEELAKRVCVTRQAVSRWETGESEPGIDMRKLLASALGISVTRLLELPEGPVCQCCGTPFDVPNMGFGTNADGSENPDYCQWCYVDGAFTSESQEALIERNVPFLVAATGYSEDEAISFMGAVVPTLKRWRETKNENISGSARRSKFYACPDCGNIMWSMGKAAITCCEKMLDPLKPAKNDDMLDASIEKFDGQMVVTVNHPMTKDDYLTFVAAVGDDLVRIKRQYPQQEARASFYIHGPAKYYAYGPRVGLVELNER